MSTNASANRRGITALGAPTAVGPYTHAVRHGDLLFCSGVLPLRPDTQELVAGSLADETSQCPRNLAAVCEAAGTHFGEALRLAVSTTDLGAFAAINDAYAAFFADDPPARVAVGVAAHAKNARVEIDAIVAVS